MYQPLSNRNGLANPFGVGSSTAGLPPSLRPYAVAYWDSRNQPAVSLPMTNIVVNGDLSNGTTGWTASYSTNTTSGGVLANTGAGTASAGVAGNVTGTTISNGVKVYAKVKYRVTNASCTVLRFTWNGTSNNPDSWNQNIANVNTPTQNAWYYHSGVATLATTNNTGFVRIVPMHFYADAVTANGKVMEVQYVLAIDLTAAFGAGNEPTAAEMDAILANYDATNSWFDGTASLVINPNGKYYMADTGALKNNPMHLLNMAYTTASGPQGGSPPYVKFDGTDDYAKCVLASVIPSATSHTFACWMRVTDVTAAKKLMYGIDGIGYRLAMLTSGSNLSVTHPGAGTASISIAGNNNKWLFCVAVYNAATKSSGVSLNGSDITYGAASAGDLSQTSVYASAVIADLTGYSAQDMADFAIFNKLLTQDEIKTLYNRRATAYGRSRI